MPLLLCPNDNSSMQTVDRNGVQFDMCPTCRGVWLDRGELDKIIERGATQAPAQPAPQPYQEPNYPPQQYDKHSNQDRNNQGYPRKKRKESFLGDLFDF